MISRWFSISSGVQPSRHRMIAVFSQLENTPLSGEAAMTSACLVTTQ
jgi:hypothetical protein